MEEILDEPAARRGTGRRSRKSATSEIRDIFTGSGRPPSRAHRPLLGAPCRGRVRIRYQAVDAPGTGEGKAGARARASTPTSRARPARDTRGCCTSRTTGTSRTWRGGSRRSREMHIKALVALAAAGRRRDALPGQLSLPGGHPLLCGRRGAFGGEPGAPAHRQRPGRARRA